MAIIDRVKRSLDADKTSVHAAVNVAAHIRHKQKLHSFNPRLLGVYQIGQEGFFDFLLGKKKETVAEVTQEDNDFCKKASAEISALRLDVNRRADIDKEIRLKYKHLSDLFTDEMELFCDALVQTCAEYEAYLTSIGSSLVLLDSLFAKGLPQDPKDLIHSLKIVNDSISASVVSFLKPFLIKSEKKKDNTAERVFVDQHACIQITHTRPIGITTVREAIDSNAGCPLAFLSQVTLTVEQKETAVKINATEIARLLICADKLIECIREIDRISANALNRAHANMKNCTLLATKYADGQDQSEQADMQEFVSVLADQTQGATYLDFGWSLSRAIDETVSVILDISRAYVKE